MSFVIDTIGQTYFLCDEYVLSGGCGNTLYVEGEMTVVGASDSGSGAIVEAPFICDTATKVYDFKFAACPPEGEDCRVNLEALVSADAPNQPAQTIRAAAGNQIPEGGFAYYLAGAAGNDTITGSRCNDFIRGNAGDDRIRARAGDDLIRPGSGNDVINTGRGHDIVYFTPDALQGGDTNTIKDFQSGIDKLSFDGSLSDYKFEGIGTKEVKVTLGDRTTTIISEATAIQASDINFIA